MTRPVRHIVRRVVLELDFDAPPAEAPRYHARATDLCRRRLAEVLDRCLSGCTEPGMLYRIDRLECVIPDIDPERLEQDWLENIEQRLQQTLREALRQAPGAGIRPGPAAAQGEYRPPDQKAAFNLLLGFLRSGVLPWWADITVRDAIPAAFQTVLASAGRPALLFHRIAADIAAQQRLVRHVNDPALSTFYGRLLDRALAEGLERSVPKFARRPEWPGLRLRFWGEVASWLTSGRQTSRPGTAAAFPDNQPAQDRVDLWMERVYAAAATSGRETPLMTSLLSPEQSSTKIPAAGAENKTNLPDARLHRTKPGDALEQHEQMPPVPANPDQTAATSGRETPLMINLPGQEQSSPKIPAGGAENKINLPDAPPHRTKPGDAPERHEKLPPAPLADFDRTDELYVHNAGIALIAPYLPRLWQQLGWTAENRFHDPATAWLAVQMIQFLCDGQPEAPPEYQLALPKILCGFGPEALFEPPRPLNDDERAEGEALLETVLEHVPGLGLRSAGALRGSFLLRNGVLRSGGFQWLLHVEKETYDLVLQKVTWGFQVLKFPWMDVAVFVEWEV